MPQKIIIPKRGNINITGEDDPLEYYYSHIFRYVYLKRMRMVLSLVGEKKFHYMLDTGAGSGIFLLSLSKKCDCLFGMDMHSRMEMVKNMLVSEEVNARLSRADLCAMPYKNNSIDCLICLSVMEFIENIDLAVREMRRIVKSDGEVIVGAPVFNMLTDWLYVIIGHRDQKIKHKSSHLNILRSLKREFCVDDIITFPRNFPLNCSLFFCVKCTRK